MSTLSPEAKALVDMPGPIVLKLQPVVNLSDDELLAFCQLNRDLRIERTAQGELVIMMPTGGQTGDRNSEINMQLRLWAKQDGTGTAFGSTTGFVLPSGAMRAPDAAWVKNERLESLTAEQWKKFLPLCPEFVLELRSPSDRLNDVQEKMEEYMANGAELGWLIEPFQQAVFVYRPNEQVEQLDQPQVLPGDPTLPGFRLDLREIW